MVGRRVVTPETNGSNPLPATMGRLSPYSIRKDAHSMKFLRFTSVFLCCALLSSFLILPASAVDDNNYYSISPVAGSEPSLAMDWPVSPAVTHDGFTAEDSQNLARIMTDLTTTGLTTLKSYIVDISDSLSRGGSIFDFLKSIDNALTDQNTFGTLVWYIKHSKDALDSLDASVRTLSGAFNGQGLATENTLKAFSDSFQSVLGNVFYTLSDDANPSYNSSLASFLGRTFAVTSNGILPFRHSDVFSYNIPWYDPSDNSYNSYWGSFSAIMGQLVSSIGIDGQASNLGKAWTLYHYVKNLSETLASEDDKQLAQNQKENREQIEQDFLSGSSGKTSLGKDDFGSLSSVGGTFKDTISLNGQSSLSDLTSGLSDADTAGQGWFSQATKDSLDAVSGSGSSDSTVSTFSYDGFSSVDVDPDPYHMQGFVDNYVWLWGDD